jgi:3-hydroxyisobutyrate dehydrogenase-like beta-hydroxyacid dehydrogenase
MELHTIGLLSPGDMGHSVGRVLTEHGLRVITCLKGRSERTRQLAAEAGIQDVANDKTLVQEAQLILSIVVPAQAVAVAERVAAAVDDGDPIASLDVTYVDCNAIAPQTAHEIEQIMAVAGVCFVDACIIGPPPRGDARTRFYVSGRHTEAMLALNDWGLDVVDLQGKAGQASGFKMCYAALTKGLTALSTELLIAAEALGITEPLTQELQESQGGLYGRMESGIPAMLPKARRWIGEMEEIACTFGALGLTPDILQGAAEVYRLVAETELSERTPEDPTPPPSLQETIATLAKTLA